MGPYGVGYPHDGLDDQGYKLYIVAVVMVVLSGLFVAARILSRLMILGRLGLDDYAIVTALAFSIVLSVMMCLAISNGYGMHKKDLPIAQLRLTMKQFFIAQTPYKIVVGLNKIAIILLYLRLFITRSFRIAAYTVLAIVVAWTIASVGATIGQCSPIRGAWNKSVKAKCIDSNTFWVAYAVGNIVTDVMVLALPIPSILALKMNLRDRLMLCGVFLLGGFVTVTSIVRVTSVQNSLKNKSDLTYNFIQRGIWTLVEANMGTISTCLPVLKQPLGRLFPRIFGSSSASKRRTMLYYPDGSHRMRGYTLSPSSAHGSQPGLWRDPQAAHYGTSVAGASASAGAGASARLSSRSAPERKSDEQYIFSQSSSSAKHSDRDSGYLDSPTPSDIQMISIEKRVDIVRQSVHDGHDEHAGA